MELTDASNGDGPYSTINRNDFVANSETDLGMYNGHEEKMKGYQMHDQGGSLKEYPSDSLTSETSLTEAELSLTATSKFHDIRFDDGVTLAELLADFDAQLAETMLTLDETENSMNQEMSDGHEERMTGYQVHDQAKDEEQEAVETVIQTEMPIQQKSLSSADSSIGEKLSTFTSFKGSPLPQKKIVTFNDRVQTIVRPLSQHDSEHSFVMTADCDRSLPPSQRSTDTANGRGRHERENMEHKSDNQQQPNEKDSRNVIYEDTTLRETTSSYAILTEDVSESQTRTTSLKAEKAAASTGGDDDDFVSTGSEEASHEKVQRLSAAVDTAKRFDQMAVSRTIMVTLTWILAGIVAELPVPTMSHWLLYFGSTEEQFSRVLATDGIGIVLGSLIGGVASSFRHQDAALAVAMMTLATNPCTHSFIYFQLTGFLCGFGRGLIFVCGMSLVVQLWEESRRAVWIHLLHAAYSIGCFLAIHLADPLIRYQLVLDSDRNMTVIVHQPAETLSLDENATTTDMKQILNDFSTPSKGSFIIIHLLHIPLVIMCFLIGTFYLYCCIRKCIQTFRMQKKSYRQLKQEETEKESNKTNKVDEAQKKNSNFFKRAGEPTTSSDEHMESRISDSRSSSLPVKHQRESSCNDHKSLKMEQECVTSKPVLSVHKTITPKSETRIAWFQDEQSFDVPILMYLYVLFVFPFGLEVSLGIFLSKYASESRSSSQRPINDDGDPSMILSVFWVSFILGRILAASLSRILASSVILIACLTLNVLCAAILSAYGNRYGNVVWIFVSVLGAFLGPLLPGGFTWANVFLQMTPKALALAYCSAGFGWATCSWFSGFLANYFGFSSLMFFVTGISSLSILLFIPVLIKLGTPGSRKRNRAIKKPHSTYV